MFTSLARLLALVPVVGLAAVSFADTVYLNFPPSMNQATRDQIKSVMQNEFDQAGAGVTVTDDPTQAGGADRTVNFKDGMSDPPGDRWGDSGDGKTVNVFVDEFTDDPNVSGEFSTPQRLGNGLGETAAHEIGHTYGLNHNQDSPPTKMTEGSLVDAKARGDDQRLFNASDSAKLWFNTYMDVVHPGGGGGGGGGRVAVAASVRPAPMTETSKHDDLGFLDAGLAVSGEAAAFELGELVPTDDPEWKRFVARSPAANTGNPVEPLGPDDVVSFFDICMVDWALHGADGTPWAGQVFSLAQFGQYALLNPRFDPELNREVFGILNLHWSSSDPLAPFDYWATLNADSVLPGTTNGFFILLLADTNLDSLRNALDIQSFVARVTGALPYMPEADCNQDGVVNALDIQKFVYYITGGTGSAVPEPSAAALVAGGLLLSLCRTRTRR